MQGQPLSSVEQLGSNAAIRRLLVSLDAGFWTEQLCLQDPGATNIKLKPQSADEEFESEKQKDELPEIWR